MAYLVNDETFGKAHSDLQHESIIKETDKHPSHEEPLIETYQPHSSLDQPFRVVHSERLDDLKEVARQE